MTIQTSHAKRGDSDSGVGVKPGVHSNFDQFGVGVGIGVNSFLTTGVGGNSFLTTGVGPESESTH